MRGLGFALCEPNFHCEVGELRSELERPSSIPTIALMGEAPVALMDTRRLGVQLIFRGDSRGRQDLHGASEKRNAEVALIAHEVIIER
jgi:hypothetical protein